MLLISSKKLANTNLLVAQFFIFSLIGSHKCMLVESIRIHQQRCKRTGFVIQKIQRHYANAFIKNENTILCLFKLHNGEIIA